MRLSLNCLLVFSALALTVTAGPSRAFAPEPDVMTNKGYSPQLIDFVEDQRDRQEWKPQRPGQLTPRERFLRNIYYNNWTGSVDKFGAQVIRGDE
ncbi:MAG: hypothetical protein K2X01_02020 [Cyanobacteria bacterium]|nr:hypothetical protein [Cyanobacteriota bacterium]